MRVDFYILEHEDAVAAEHYLCRLLEKAVLNKHRLFVWCEHQAQAESLDEQLWIFRQDAFVPHHLQGEGPEPPPPVQIAWLYEPIGSFDILVNLNPVIPEFYRQFNRVIEVVPANEHNRDISRQHYRHYQQQGCTINVHKIESQSN